MGKKYVTPELSVDGLATKGKIYNIIEFVGGERLAEVVLDNGERHVVVTEASPKKCSHLKSKGRWLFTDKQVRPAMTQEARDILNSIHETVGAETRSDSIVEFMDKHTDMEVELCAVKSELYDVKVELCAVKVASHSWERRFKDSSNRLSKERKKSKSWMIYSAIVAAYAIGVSVYCLIQ